MARIGLTLCLVLLGCGPELDRVEGAMEVWVAGLSSTPSGTVRIAVEDDVSEIDTTLSQPAFIASVPVGEVSVLVRTANRRSNRVTVVVFEGEVAKLAVQLLDDLDHDRDGDGIPARRDNCPRDANDTQRDSDRDGWGDACDVCRTRNDPTQADLDQDGVGDLCDPDVDGDAVLNVADECPFDASGATDADGDGVCDAVDNCGVARNPSQDDCDGDGMGDSCDLDIDDDDVPNGIDLCPFAFDPEQLDVDRNGLGDACEADPSLCVPGGAP